MPQYREFDTTDIDCIYPSLPKEMTWGEVVITLSENLDKCVSSFELVIKTLNPDE